MEGNTLHINEHQVTVEFQPSADQAWQHWEGITLSSTATYPSPYANVHKSETSKIGGTIGLSDSDTWSPPTVESIASDAENVRVFRESLPPVLAPEKVHKQILQC